MGKSDVGREKMLALQADKAPQLIQCRQAERRPTGFAL
jgi:hypothetical protein